MAAAPATVELLPPVEGLSPARRRLYTTALRLFAEHGYHAISVRDITDALGQRPGALYSHAASKQGLLGSLARIGVTEHRDRLRAAVLDAGSDPEAQLRALVRAHVLVHIEYPALAQVVTREARVLDEAQALEATVIIQESERTLLDLIARGQRSGAFGADVDVYLVVKAIGAIGGQVSGWWTPDAPRTPDRIADTFADYALRMLR